MAANPNSVIFQQVKVYEANAGPGSVHIVETKVKDVSIGMVGFIASTRPLPDLNSNPDGPAPTVEVVFSNDGATWDAPQSVDVIWVDSQNPAVGYVWGFASGISPVFSPFYPWTLDDTVVGIQTRYIRVANLDGAGFTSTSASVTTVEPTINTFTINNYNDTQAELTVTISDSTRFRVSNNKGSTWGSWVDVSALADPYTDATFTFDLGPVYDDVGSQDYQFDIEIENDFGTVSGSAVIVIPMTGSFVINNNDDLTTSKSVELNMSVENAEDMRFRNEDDEWPVSFDDYSDTKQWVLADIHGTRTVWGEFLNSNSSLVLKDTIAYLKVIPPTSIQAEAGTDFIDVTWDESIDEGFVGYNLYRSLISGIGYAKVNDELLTTNSYLDRDVIVDVTYYYVVTIVVANGRESDISNEASATPEEQSIELTKNYITFRGKPSNVKVYWTDGNLFTRKGLFKIKGNISELPDIEGDQFRGLGRDTIIFGDSTLQEDEE